MKKIRLNKSAYSEKGQSCLLTICSFQKKLIFDNSNYVRVCADKLQELCRKRGFGLLVYCFMPDYLHILLNNRESNSIIDLMREFKYSITRQGWLFGFKGKIFQQSFHDQFIRSEKELAQMMQYMAENPLRKGLPDDWRQPPYVGSTLFNLE